MATGWMPGVDRYTSPNFTPGRSGLAVRACVLHIAEGTYSGSITWLCNPVSGASAHFMIGKDGRIGQMVPIDATAWGNGLSFINGHWVDPEGNTVKPDWPGLVAGVNPNTTTISIEHAGHTGEPWTEAMIAADAKVLQWIAAQTGLTYRVGDTLIGHRDISPIARARCPGSGCPFAAIAAAANTGQTPPAAPDFAAAWGTAFTYFADSGIAASWRTKYQQLGMATTDEMNVGTFVARAFEHGLVVYDPKTGRAQPVVMK